MLEKQQEVQEPNLKTYVKRQKTHKNEKTEVHH